MCYDKMQFSFCRCVGYLVARLYPRPTRAGRSVGRISPRSPSSRQDRWCTKSTALQPSPARLNPNVRQQLPTIEMRLRCSKGIAFRVLKRPQICPRCLVQTQHRSFSTDDNIAPDRKKIAVLGGGITGLTSAFYLSKNSPNAHITLYEKTSRLGGWIDSERVQVDGGEILFEHGPHTLRPGGVAGLIPLELVMPMPAERTKRTNRRSRSSCSIWKTSSSAPVPIPPLHVIATSTIQTI